MERRYLIGVDVGTQGTKASLYTRQGETVCQTFRETALHYGPAGEITQDPEELFGSVLATVRELTECSGVEKGRVEAMGLDAQMAGILGVDETYRAVTPYDSWLDTRCEPYIAKMKELAGDEIVRKTGGQVTYAHGPKILWWKGEHPGLYQKIRKFVTLQSYLCARLCGLKGEEAYVDYTHLHFTGFADSAERRWDPGLMSCFGVDEDKLPRIAAPWERVGTLSRETAGRLGLAEGMPVAAGCGDSAASSLGAGILEKGMVYDVAGTASIFSLSTDRFVPDIPHRTILTARSAVDGLFIPLAYLGGGGLCIRWFKQLVGKSYEELEHMASGVAEEINDLYFIPHFAGRTCPNEPGIRGGFHGLSWNHEAGHLYRSILESIVLEYNLFFKILQELDPGIRPTGIYGVGGGTRCRLFNQLKADVLGLAYHRIQVEEAATWGSAVLAGRAVGMFDSLEAAGGSRKIVETYLPCEERHAAYTAKTKRYGELLRSLGGEGRQRA